MYLLGKNLRVSGPVQFKPMLFKGQPNMVAFAIVLALRLKYSDSTPEIFSPQTNTNTQPTYQL